MAKQTKKTTRKKTTSGSLKNQKVKVKILNPVFGKYRIVAEVGHTKEVYKQQADELIANGDAEEAK